MKVDFTKSSGDLLVDRRYQYAENLLQEAAFDEAIDLIEQTILICPDWPPLWFLKGEILYLNSCLDLAINAFDHYLSLDPTDIMGAKIKCAIIQENNTTAKISKAYVEHLFDEYAYNFDNALLNGLGYRVPEQILDCLKDQNPFVNYNDFLDLGCGTGLMGKAVEPITINRTGIDLSEKMLIEAHKKKIYQRLEKQSLEVFLSTQKDKSYDLVLAADVFVYIGDLEHIIRDIKRILRPSGVLGFSVQMLKNTATSFLIGDDHRYAHNKNYILETLNNAGFNKSRARDVVLRKDRGKDVCGIIFVACC